MNIVKCDGCGKLHEKNKNNARTIGFKHLCGNPRCEKRVFGSRTPRLEPSMQLEIKFGKKHPQPVPIDYEHFGSHN